jgi:hypothetical protein
VVLGAVVGIVWCVLDSVGMSHQVVAVTVIMAVLFALIAVPVGAMVLELVGPKSDSPRPYSPSATAQLIAFCMNLSVLIPTPFNAHGVGSTRGQPRARSPAALPFTPGDGPPAPASGPGRRGQLRRPEPNQADEYTLAAGGPAGWLTTESDLFGSA